MPPASDSGPSAAGQKAERENQLGGLRVSIRSITLLSQRRYRRVLSAPEPSPIARRTLGPNNESPSTRINRCVAANSVSSSSGDRRPSLCALRTLPACILSAAGLNTPGVIVALL